MLKVLLITILIFSNLFGDFYLKPSVREKSKIDKMPKAHFGDLDTIPQDISYYAKQIQPFTPLEQQNYYNKYIQKYFQPWSRVDLLILKKDFEWESRFVRDKPIYDDKNRQISPEVYESWIDNENMGYYSLLKQKAITIKRVDLKAFPTDESFYRNPYQAGEGFPFDYNQNSAYPINMPLTLSHYSKDGKWAFVQGAYAFGWVKVSDVAVVDDTFIRDFMSGNYAVSIKDNSRLFENKKPISLVKIGTLFPFDSNGYFFATKDSSGFAKLQKFRVTQKELIANMPLAFNTENVIKIASQFKDEPYGWGEEYETRDCSALTRDFFAPFGIFLDRNSGQQAQNGSQISIKNMEREAKKSAILTHAKPFRSLLFVPGHIVLYLGEYNNQPIIMHAYWGIRQNDWSKLITGRTIISTTEIGNDLNTTRKLSQPIETFSAIVNF